MNGVTLTTILNKNYFFKLWQQPHLIWLLAIVSIAGSVRLFNLDLLGPFIDEGGHLHLATHYDYFPLFERAGQGGKVLGFILFFPTARWAQNPLHATRLLVATIGVITTIAIFLTTRRICGLKPAILAGLMWALLPYITFHDRLALHDPLISCFIIWAIFFLIGALEDDNDRLKSFISGFLVSLATITKFSAIISLIWLLLISLVYIDFKNLRKYLPLLITFVIGIVLPLSIILFILLPHINQLIQYTDHFVSLSSATQSRWELVINNMTKTNNWFNQYNSIYFSLFSGLALLLTIWRPSKIKFALLLSFIITLVVYISSFQVWFSRYLVPSLIPMVMWLALVSAEWLTQAIKIIYIQKGQISHQWFNLIPATLILIFLGGAIPAWVSLNLTLQTNPTRAKIPDDDRFQYFNGWPSSNGLTEVVSFLNQLTQNSTRETLVITGGFGRHGLWSIPMMVKDNPHLEFRTLTGSPEEAHQLLNEAATKRILALLEPPMATVPIGLSSLIASRPVLIFEYKRPQAEGGFQIYELDTSPVK